jgi:release factor H-coupled RctB family protein
MMIEKSTQQSIIRIIASEKSWIEGEAVRQLENTAALHNMKLCVGLPDLHPGRGTPVGAAFYTGNMLYPHIVGNDAGCGIGLWQTSLKMNKIKRDRWVRKLKELHSPWDGDISRLLQQYGLESNAFNPMLGTIGSGNHFAELQKVEKIFCQKSFRHLGLNNKKLFLLIHSGSRGIGEKLLRKHTDQYGNKGLEAGSKAAKLYLKKHDYGITWAQCNRAVIAKRFANQLNTECRPVLDLCHNSVTQVELNGTTGWLHRKGAAPSNQGMLVIPGSRGSLSYLVIPTGEQSKNLWSLAHGAGRKWNRSSCRGRLKPQFSSQALCHTAMGSVVICDDKKLLYEEAPQAYKDIHNVIDAMKSEGLITIIATFRPVITYKLRNT